MQLNLNPAFGHNFDFSATIPPDFAGSVLPGGLVITATDPKFGRVVQQEYTNSHYTIRLYFFEVLQPDRLQVFHAGSFLSSILAVKNNLDYRIEGLEDLKLKHGQFALLHSAGRPATIHFTNQRPHEFLEIAWSKHWLAQLLTRFDFLKALFTPANADKSYYLKPHPKPAGMLALDKVQKIIKSPYDDATTRLLFESHTWQYLVLILVESAKASNRLMSLTDREEQILKAIGEEEIINHRKKRSLNELATRANMSITKFKNACNQFFGTTLERHKMKARMEKAKQLLLEGKLSVKQVSEKVNYKSANSFSKKFKNHFGYLPTEVDKHQ